MEGNLNRNSRVIVTLISAFVSVALLTTMLSAQVLEKLPYSGGVLTSRALRSGRIHLPAVNSSNVGANPDLTCSPAPCVFTPVRASNGGSQPANENPVAVSPINALKLLSGANDYNCSNIQGFYATTDGGTTWNHTCSPGSGGQGDPVVGYDRLGNTFAGGIQNGSFKIFISTNDGTTWGAPITVTGPLLGYLADKDWMEVDHSTTSPFVNNIYYSGTQFASNSDSQISVSVSSDHGQTWSTKLVDTRQHYPTFVDQFTDLGIGADGTVYVTWIRCPANGPAGDCGGTTTNVMFSKSVDGGLTWTPAVAAFTTMLAPDNCGAFYGCLPNTSERVSNIPAVEVNGSGATAKVYIIYYNWTGTKLQTMLRTSIDGGVTWSAGTVVSSASGDQFFPWVSLLQGRIIASWLDRRNDPSNVKYQPMFAMSSNGGTSFGAAHLLSSKQSNPLNDGFGGAFMGDYRTSVTSGTSFYAVWMDTTTGTNNVQDEFGGAKLH
jgi:hypothetical protein